MYKTQLSRKPSTKNGLVIRTNFCENANKSCVISEAGDELILPTPPRN